MGWISGQTDYGYFLSGMSLLVLAAFCFRSQTLPSRRSPELPLAPLGAFALCHALHEWSFLVLAILRSGEPWRDLLPGGFLFLSLLCLLEFGRRLTSPLIPLKTWSWRLYAPLCLLAPLGVWLGLDVEVWAGLFLALPAAFYALRGMIRLSARQQAGDRKLALGLGGVIALHPLLPALWPLCSATLASGTLRTGAGLAVQLLHASLALLAALLVWGYSGAAKRRLLHGGLFLLAMVTIMGAGWALTCFLGRVADLQIKTETYSRTSTIAAFLQDDLSDVDQAARALSSSVAVAAALGSGRPGELQRASLELERYRKSLGITSCFLLDRSGTLVAAADLRPGAAQIGRSYAFRPYFQGALAGRQSHYFALSKASGERCFFAAAPVLGHTGAVIGVAVGMRGVEGVEVEFQKYPEVALVSPEGIVFISSQKRFLFRSLWPVPREQRVRLAASGQFGPLSFVPLLEREPPPGRSSGWRGGRCTPGACRSEARGGPCSSSSRRH